MAIPMDILPTAANNPDCFLSSLGGGRSETCTTHGRASLTRTLERRMR